LVVSNLTAIHQKTLIGRLSAYCGAISAGCAAACGVAYLLGEDLETISKTLTNSLAVTSGIICDGAKASCAAKIATAVESGLMGYYMCKNKKNFCDGDGIIGNGVEKTIKNVGTLASKGMRETDKVIIGIMTE
jgi:L-cysteine desulfidase